jgi:hypothetical protein
MCSSLCLQHKLLSVLAALRTSAKCARVISSGNWALCAPLPSSLIFVAPVCAGAVALFLLYVQSVSRVTVPFLPCRCVANQTHLINCFFFVLDCYRTVTNIVVYFFIKVFHNQDVQQILLYLSCK